MATYIALCNWTQQGIEAVKDSPKRLAAARKAFKDGGAKLKDFYLTMGAYDFVVVAEAPDDDSMARAALSVAATGAIRTTTMRAFPEKDYRAIIASLP